MGVRPPVALPLGPSHDGAPDGVVADVICGADRRAELFRDSGRVLAVLVDDVFHCTVAVRLDWYCEAAALLRGCRYGQ